MRRTLIDTKDANTQENQLYPALDGGGKIKFGGQDGTPACYNVQTIKCLDILQNGKNEIPFWLNDIRDKSWEVFVTDQRIAVYNPYSKGLIGKAKEKPGKSSVGHIYYKSMCNLSTFFSQENGKPVLICACFRNDGTKSSIAIESNDIQEMKKLVSELHGRIERWIGENNKKIVIDDKTAEGIKKAVNNWDTFLERVWTVKNGDVTVFVPCNEWDKVADSI